MPGFASTPLGESAEEAIDILGNRIRVAILAFLRADGPAQRGEIAAGLGLLPGSVSNQLLVLVKAGLIITDVPQGEITPGMRVRYLLAPKRVDELYQALGDALGVSARCRL